MTASPRGHCRDAPRLAQRTVACKATSQVPAPTIVQLDAFQPQSRALHPFSARPPASRRDSAEVQRKSGGKRPKCTASQAFPQVAICETRALRRIFTMNARIWQKAAGMCEILAENHRSVRHEPKAPGQHDARQGKAWHSITSKPPECAGSWLKITGVHGMDQKHQDAGHACGHCLRLA